MSIESTIARAGHTISVQRKTEATWTTVYSSVAAWVQPAMSQVVAEYGERELSVTHSIFVATAMTLREGDRVVYGSGYYVIRGHRNVGGLNKLWRVDVG